MELWAKGRVGLRGQPSRGPPRAGQPVTHHHQWLSRHQLHRAKKQPFKGKKKPVLFDWLCQLLCARNLRKAANTIAQVQAGRAETPCPACLLGTRGRAAWSPAHCRMRRRGLLVGPPLAPPPSPSSLPAGSYLTHEASGLDEHGEAREAFLNGGDSHKRKEEFFI